MQARTGSTRLSHKTLLPFHGDKGIFEVLAENFRSVFGSDRLVLATTVNPGDDVLVEIATRLGIRVYRGSEANVLERFVRAAETFKAEVIVRVCADNPFLLPSLAAELLESFDAASCDYLSYQDQNIPVIKTHWGLFTEVVTLHALQKVMRSTEEPLYREHVTNFIYTHPEKFNVQLLPLPGVFNGRSGYRFTLDTTADFVVLRELFGNLHAQHQRTLFTPAELFAYLDTHGQHLHQAMKTEMDRNVK